MMHTQNTKSNIASTKPSLKKIALALVLSTTVGGALGAEPTPHKSIFSGSSQAFINSSVMGNDIPNATYFKHNNNGSALLNLQKNPEKFHQLCYVGYIQNVTEKREIAGELLKKYERGLQLQKQIETLNKQLEAYNQILRDFGRGDREAALKKIDEDIALFQIKIQNNSAESLPIFKAQTEENKKKIETYQANREILKQDTKILEETLKITREKFSDLVGNTELNHFKKEIERIKEELNQAYADHTVGPMDQNLISDEIIVTLLKTFENSGLTIGKLDTKRLYQLLARSLELPYSSYFMAESGVDCAIEMSKQDQWMGQAEKLKERLVIRLREDLMTLDFAIQMSLSCQFDLTSGLNEHFNFGKNPSELSKILLRANTGMPVLQEDQFNSSMKALNTDLGLYIDKINDPNKQAGTYFGLCVNGVALPEILNANLMKTCLGYFGLCIESLSQAPVTSWPGEMSGLLYFKHYVKNEKEMSEGVLTLIQSIVRRHVNVEVLDLLMVNMKKSKECASETPQSDEDWYI